MRQSGKRCTDLAIAETKALNVLSELQVVHRTLTHIAMRRFIGKTQLPQCQIGSAIVTTHFKPTRAPPEVGFVEAEPNSPFVLQPEIGEQEAVAIEQTLSGREMIRVHAESTALHIMLGTIVTRSDESLCKNAMICCSSGSESGIPGSHNCR
jgi:hypothetical protein